MSQNVKSDLEIAQANEKEHIKHEQKWIKSPDGRAWQIARK